MEPKDLVSKILSASRSIRYVAVVGPAPEYALLESRMKTGVASLTSEKTDREFVQMIPKVFGPAEDLQKDLGEIAYVVIRYQKVALTSFRALGYTVTVSVEPDIPIYPIYDRIQKALELSR